MPFTLRIRFSGLCLFVPKRDTANLMRMHVLMPNVVNGGHCGERHIPVLKFDTAHLHRDQRNKHGIIAQRDILGWSMGIGTGEASSFICPEIVKLRDVTGQDVPDDLLQQSPETTALGARVTLADGGMVRVARGKCWNWASGQTRRMAHIVVWEVEVDEDVLNLSLTPLGNGQPEPLPSLFPIVLADGSRFIDLSLHNLTPDDLAPIPPVVPEPGPLAPARHFAAYYDLYPPITQILLPLYQGRECDLPADPCDEEQELGSSAFNCMLGSGA